MLKKELQELVKTQETQIEISNLTIQTQKQDILLLKTKLSAWRGMPRPYELQYKGKE